MIRRCFITRPKFSLFDYFCNGFLIPLSLQCVLLAFAKRSYGILGLQLVCGLAALPLHPNPLGCLFAALCFSASFAFKIKTALAQAGRANLPDKLLRHETDILETKLLFVG